MLQICQYVSRETFSVWCVLVISLHHVQHLWHDILHGGWQSHQSSPRFFWHFHYLCSLFLCLTSAVFTTALCSPENRRQVLLSKYTQSLMVFGTGRCGKTGNRIVNFINNSFFFFKKPVQRTDKEYLPPRSCGLLQLCTLTGATSRLSKP